METNNTPEKTAMRTNCESVQRHAWLLSSIHFLSSALIRACILQVFLNKNCLVLLLNPFTLQWSPSFCQDRNLGVVFESPSSHSLDLFISGSWDSVSPLLHTCPDTTLAEQPSMWYYRHGFLPAVPIPRPFPMQQTNRYFDTKT